MKLFLALLLSLPASCMAFQVAVDTSDEVMKHLPKINKRFIRQNDQVDKYLCDERAWRQMNVPKSYYENSNPSMLLHQDIFPLKEPMVDPDMYNADYTNIEEDLLRQNDQVDRYLDEDRVRLFHHDDYDSSRLRRHTDIIDPYLYDERLMFKPPPVTTTPKKDEEILKDNNNNDPYVEEERLDKVLSSENQKQHLGIDAHHPTNKKMYRIEIMDDENTGIDLILEDWDMHPAAKKDHTIGDGHNIFSYVPSTDDLHG